MSQFYDKVYKKMCEMGDRYDARRARRIEFCTRNCSKIVLAFVLTLCALILLGMKLLPETVTVMYSSDIEKANYYAKNVFVLRYTGLVALTTFMFRRNKQPMWAVCTIGLLLAFGLHIFIGI